MSVIPEADSVLKEESPYHHSGEAMLQGEEVQIESRVYDPDISKWFYWVYKTTDGKKTWREYISEDELSPV